MHRTMRVAAMVDVPGFLLERLPVDIPAGVEGQERVMASGKAFRAFFLGHFLPPVWENLSILGALLLDSGVLGSTIVQKPQLVFKPIEK